MFSIGSHVYELNLPPVVKSDKFSNIKELIKKIPQSLLIVGEFAGGLGVGSAIATSQPTDITIGLGVVSAVLITGSLATSVAKYYINKKPENFEQDFNGYVYNYISKKLNAINKIEKQKNDNESTILGEIRQVLILDDIAFFVLAALEIQDKSIKKWVVEQNSLLGQASSETERKIIEIGMSTQINIFDNIKRYMLNFLDNNIRTFSLCSPKYKPIIFQRIIDLKKYEANDEYQTKIINSKKIMNEQADITHDWKNTQLKREYEQAEDDREIFEELPYPPQSSFFLQKKQQIDKVKTELFEHGPSF